MMLCGFAALFRQLPYTSPKLPACLCCCGALLALQVYLATVLLLCHRDIKELSLQLVQEGCAQHLVGARAVLFCKLGGCLCRLDISKSQQKPTG
jgi:hypothetical protein